MDTYAVGTRCEKPLYHAAISPEPPHRMTPEQRTEAINALEEKLGLQDHARVVVLHEKEGREHLHVVWSRIDLEKMKSVSDSHNYRKHEEVARDLERRFGHDRVQGAHHEREGVERPDRTPSRSELRQEERTGITGKEVKAEVTAAFRASDGADAFKAALEDRGYLLAQGDRRDFVVVDREGGVHSLARRIDGVKAAELREFMQPIDRESLPTVEQAKSIQLERAVNVAPDRADRGDEFASVGYERFLRNDDEDGRRLRDDRADHKIEAAYGRSDSYVAQSTAALKDHQRRQERLDDGNEFRPEHPDDRRAREASEPTPQQPEARPDAQTEFYARSQKNEQSGARPDPEITDRMARLLGGSDHEHEREHEHDPPEADHDRHSEAPGGGRSRSRFE
jgi:hypothetical protein